MTQDAVLAETVGAINVNLAEMIVELQRPGVRRIRQLDFADSWARSSMRRAVSAPDPRARHACLSRPW
jgi:hypothetical protein